MRHGERKRAVSSFMMRRNRLPATLAGRLAVAEDALRLLSQWAPRIEQNIGSYQPIGFAAFALLELALKSNSQLTLQALHTKLEQMHQYDPGPNYRIGRDETIAMLLAIVEQSASATSAKGH